jgi:tetratricopeptide (TPR) repeat protein
MKPLSYIVLFLTLLSFPAYSNPLLEKAEKAYDSRNYKEAIASYEQLIGEGYVSWQLYFNLGNAYYRNNELGRAIYYYELARKIEPADEDVRVNLAIAAGKTTDKIDAKENFFISAVKTNLLSYFSTRTWAWLTITGLLAASALFFLFVSAPAVLVKRLAFVLSCCFLIATIVVYLLGYSAVKARYENKFAIILVREVKIMNEPTAMAKMKFTLHEGTKIRVVNNNGDWLLIKLDNGNEGWVKTSEVGVI